MRKRTPSLLALGLLALAGCAVRGPAGVGGPREAVDGRRPATPLEELQRRMVDLRFGMFLHFGILTYTGSWAEPGLDITKFDPTALDPNQWADAATAAGMKFGVLTARHHDGFALWPSKASRFNVSAIPWMNGRGDVVRAYVDAFRRHGLAPGLYYSIWDANRGVGGRKLSEPSVVTADDLAYVETQLTELLTNYGPIPLLVFDGWAWRMGHRQVPYERIRALVKSIQPDCLMLDNTHLYAPWENDLVGVEEAQGNTFVPPGNSYPAVQMQKINAKGGNDWFWAPDVGGLMTVSEIVEQHLRVLEPRWTDFLLNCPPDRRGLLDDAIVARLREVGAAWSPDTGRPPLPEQGPQLERPYEPAPGGAVATSGVAADAVDGVNDFYRYTIWQSAGPPPQAITVDLGRVRSDVGMLVYVPRYLAKQGPSAAGAITAFEIDTSADGAQFATAARGAWPGDDKMHVATFGPAAARYVRVQVLAANGGKAAATEISVGGLGRAVAGVLR